MEADGREEIETVADYYAKWDDYYRPGTTFSDTSTPSSKKYDGSASNVSVGNIPAAGTSMTFTAGVGAIARDETAPVATVTGAEDGGYVNHDVTLIVTGADEPGGSGVARIVYELDDGGEQTVAGDDGGRGGARRARTARTRSCTTRWTWPATPASPASSRSPATPSGRWAPAGARRCARAAP